MNHLTRWAAALALTLCLATPAHAGNWRQEADARIEKIRKTDATVELVDIDGKPLGDVEVTARQIRSAFYFGTAYNAGFKEGDPNAEKYTRFLVDHFNMLTPEFQQKWDIIEPTPGTITFEQPDAVVKFAQDNHLALRGHALFWPKAHRIPQWNKDLTDADLRKAVEAHLERTATHYAGKVYCWDVCNEILDGPYYREHLGNDIEPWFFKRTHELDPKARLFVNEYAMFGNPEKTQAYVDMVKRLRAAGATIDGIGVQDHGLQRFDCRTDPTTRPFFGRQPAGPRPEEILTALDKLAELKAPIQLTELTCATINEARRADCLEMIFRIAYSHPSVEATVLWGFWSKRHFKGVEGAIVDADWNLLPAGKRLDDMLLKEWRTNFTGRSDAQGQLGFRGFQGTYEFTVKRADGKALTGQANLAASMKVVLKGE